MTTPQQPVPLSDPYYGATIGVAFSRFWSKYTVFSGRASRSEYWWWALIEAIVWLVLSILARPGGAGVTNASGAMTGPNGLGVFVAIVVLVFGLATIIPNLSLTIRRLHDANFSGFFILLGLVPVVGPIVVFILSLLSSNPEGRRFDRVS